MFLAVLRYMVSSKALRRVLKGSVAVCPTILSLILFAATDAYSSSCQSILSAGQFQIHNMRDAKALFNSIESKPDVLEFVSSLEASTLDINDNLKFLKNGRLLKKTNSLLEDFSLEEANALLEVLLKLEEIHLSREFVEALEQSVSLSLGESSAHGLVRFIQLMEGLKVLPSEDLRAALENQMSLKINKFTPAMLSNLIFRYGSWGVLPGEDLLGRWRENVQKKSSKFQARQIANALYGAYLSGDKRLLEELIGVFSLGQVASLMEDPIHVRQISMIHLYMKKVLGVEFPKLKFFEGLFADFVKKPSNRSLLENKMARVLDAEEVSFVEEYKALPGFYVDFYIPFENKVIQTDGPWHYVVDYSIVPEMRMLSLKDQKMDEILRAFGYEVERLDHFQVETRFQEMNRTAVDEEDHASQKGFRNPFGLIQ